MRQGMIVDTTKIEGVFEFQFSAEEAELEFDLGDFRLSGPVTVKGEVVRAETGFSVRGRILGEAEADCTRCLASLKKDLDIAFDVAHTLSGNTPGDIIQLEFADLDSDELAGDGLDLLELVREQIILSRPEQEFCTESCRGLCQECGVNLNLIDCNCSVAGNDPRWSALAELKGKII